MPKTEEISVFLTSDQIAALRAAIDAGDYATPGEIVREALRDWGTKRQLRAQDIERLRRLWDEGKASGPAQRLDFAELRREARERFAAIT